MTLGFPKCSFNASKSLRSLALVERRRLVPMLDESLLDDKVRFVIIAKLFPVFFQDVDIYGEFV